MFSSLSSLHSQQGRTYQNIAISFFPLSWVSPVSSFTQSRWHIYSRRGGEKYVLKAHSKHVLQLILKLSTLFISSNSLISRLQCFKSFSSPLHLQRNQDKEKQVIWNLLSFLFLEAVTDAQHHSHCPIISHKDFILVFLQTEMFSIYPDSWLFLTMGWLTLIYDYNNFKVLNGLQVSILHQFWHF